MGAGGGGGVRARRGWGAAGVGWGVGSAYCARMRQRAGWAATRCTGWRAWARDEALDVGSEIRRHAPAGKGGEQMG